MSRSLSSSLFASPRRYGQESEWASAALPPVQRPDQALIPEALTVGGVPGKYVGGRRNNRKP